ncbi:hypothetical protein [Roseomonas indoligenes]|uniref:Uncharacterized protein n=1 Tax=Roseomonas indoligenes TaxID=2820811 RepID=A0A940MWC4_9PROT|nr:hypothetical protein [Pararoseomonas indoligenes]MBP0492195.1 hypothetical protein [Pararoseomonas indoligenes]
MPLPMAEDMRLLAKVRGLLSARDAQVPVSVIEQFPAFTPDVVAWIEAGMREDRADRIRLGIGTARDYAVAFLQTLERGEPEWILAEWSCALDGPFVLLTLFDRRIKGGESWALMEWAGARLLVKVDLTSGAWSAKPAGAPREAPTEAAGPNFGSLAAWRWSCKHGAALIRLAKLIEKGRAA